MTNDDTLAQRAQPCPTCPYVRSTPPGIWGEVEYRKLPQYDGETFEQHPAVFLCHYSNRGLRQETLCQGWLDCHGATQLLAIRLAAVHGTLPADFSFDPSGADVYPSGQAACDAGLAGIDIPSPAARRAITKLEGEQS